MRVNTAEELYELAKHLPLRERFRLVERIAHDLTLPAAATAGESVAGTGRRVGVSLLGQVIDVSFDPLGLTLRTRTQTVTMRAEPHLSEDARAALGKEALVEAEALIDPEGAVLEASATAIRVSADADDLVDVFDATFGSGRDALSSPEGQAFLASMIQAKDGPRAGEAPLAVSHRRMPGSTGQGQGARSAFRPVFARPRAGALTGLVRRFGGLVGYTPSIRARSSGVSSAPSTRSTMTRTR
jgi:hypothetical protein